MDKSEQLQKLKKRMEADNSLPLRAGATNLVFGVGNPNTQMLFVGEGPGYYEDQSGEPFVGRAGKFLDFLLSTIEIARKSVYITNVVHHRPPNNRDPEPNELLKYGEYLDKMIEVIDPAVVVTLCRFSMRKFLPGVYISHVHGKIHKLKWRGKDLTIVPMYHPAAGLRNPQIKDATTEDFKVLREVLKSAREDEQKDLSGEQMTLV